jgi:hypothetical protein
MLEWIEDIKDVYEALDIVRYAADWKRRYAATNRLAYLNAARINPYVKTIVCSQIVRIGTIRHLETDLPVYSADCICWEQQRTVNNRCYFLGKTGSPTIDDSIRTIDWVHQTISPEMQLSRTESDARCIESLRYRLGYYRTEKTAKQRRNEIALYCRKLVWLESISMLDSKNAGNCLPGTLQFCRELGIEVSDQWNDVSIDSRLMIRKWKASGYNSNRLLLPAIDTAVKRVGSSLASICAVNVPSFVR